MAFIKSFEENKAALKGEDPTQPIPTGGGGDFAPPSISPDVSQAAPLAAPAPQAPQIAGAGPTLEQVAQELTGLSGEVSALGTGFLESAGAGRTFGEPEQQILSGAVKSGELDPAFSLLSGIGYQGPAGLDQEAVARIGQEAADLGAYSGQLASGRGLTAYIQGANPGITPGEAKFEAQRTAGDQPAAFKGEAETLSREAQAIQTALEEEAQKAQGYAQTRTEQEKAYADAARGYLETLKGGILDPVQQQMASRQAAEDALEAAYGAFSQTGDLDALLAAAPSNAQLQALSQAYAPIQAARGDVDKIKADIASKYPEIQGIETADLVAPLGVEFRSFTINGKDYLLRQLLSGETVIEGLSKEESQRIAQQLNARQLELEQYFAPGGMYLGNEPATTAGQYAYVEPLYFDVPPYGVDIKNYVQYTGAPDPTIQNTASAQQLAELNAIAELLGEASRYQPSAYTDPALQALVQEFEAQAPLSAEDIEKRIQAMIASRQEPLRAFPLVESAFIL